jgi:hypothetical protein
MKYFFSAVLSSTVLLAGTFLPEKVLALTPLPDPNAPTPTITYEQIPGTDIQLGDFVVGPGRLELIVRPGESVTRNISVTNRIDDQRSFAFAIEDMSGSADGSQAAVLLGDQNGPYSLRDYVSVPQPIITLGLGQRAQVPVTITMPENAEPGGYYGGILVSTIQDEGTTDGAVARSPIVARVGTLFFIQVPGEVERSGALVDFSTLGNEWWYDKGPIDLGITYENTGSVHLNPYGEIRIKNMMGSEIGFVEIEPWFVLPKSLRTREVTWDNQFLLGRYTVTASINRGYDDIVDEQTVHIWVLPWQFLLTVFGGLFVLFFLIRLFLNTFELKKRV